MSARLTVPTRRSARGGNAWHRGVPRIIGACRGVTSIEFALVALVLMLWIFGIMEAARAYWTYQIIEEVAIEGARCMGVLASGCSSGGAYSASATTTYIQTLASSRGLSIPASDITLTRPAVCASLSSFSQVDISYTFNTEVPSLIPAFNALA
ncbi:MAG TPA: TadE/TadG family type IV pilus assembly protein, partial [Rhodopila sp.]|nr:TadE/TadG family type IV pilus assembly protein [Rhodopila sp.]